MIPNYEVTHLEHSDQEIWVHNETLCDGQKCTIHRRSNHHMRSFKQYWRNDSMIMERICPHGIGHPDPDEPALDTIKYSHGCDGCCSVDIDIVTLSLSLDALIGNGTIYSVSGKTFPKVGVKNGV